MIRRLLLAFPLAIAPLLLHGCDAMRGASFRFEVVDSVSGGPVPDATVRMFWFDEPGDVLGNGPVEERAAEVGEGRRHRRSYGLYQKEWIESETDDKGMARLPVCTFVAGAAGLLLHDLILGAREGDPTALWIRVQRKDEPAAQVQDFMIIEGDEGPGLVRIRVVGGQPVAGEVSGTVTPVRIGGEFKHCWRVVIPIER